MSLTKLSLGENNDVIYKLFPPRESSVSDIPAGEGNIKKLFLRCSTLGGEANVSGQTVVLGAVRFHVPARPAARQVGGIDSLESIPGLLKSLKTPSLYGRV